MVFTGQSFNWGQDKAKPHVAIPEAADVSKITLKAEKLLPGGPFELNLTKPEEVKPLLTWLKDVGWDYSKSGDARVIRVAPVAFIAITQKNKADLNFVVSERLIIAGDRYWPIDKQKLEAVIKGQRAFQSVKTRQVAESRDTQVARDRVRLPAARSAKRIPAANSDRSDSQFGQPNETVYLASPIWQTRSTAVRPKVPFGTKLWKSACLLVGGSRVAMAIAVTPFVLFVAFVCWLITETPKNH
jgi:hypothetical protein